MVFQTSLIYIKLLLLNIIPRQTAVNEITYQHKTADIDTCPYPA